MSIRVEHLTKRFVAFHAVDDVSFVVEPGELVGLLGPSGGGKSTVLRIIAGLERADDGIATVTRVLPLGDRVKVEARLDDGSAIFAQFPRRSSLLRGVERGVRIQIEVTLARLYPRGAAPGAE